MLLKENSLKNQQREFFRMMARSKGRSPLLQSQSRELQVGKVVPKREIFLSLVPLGWDFHSWLESGRAFPARVQIQEKQAAVE